MHMAHKWKGVLKSSSNWLNYTVFTRDVCVSRSLTFRLETKMPWRQTPLMKEESHAKMFISFSIICYTQMCVKTWGGGGGICCCCFCSITTTSIMFLKTAFISLCSTGDLFNSHPHLLSWLALRWLRCFQQRGSVCCWCRLSHAHLSRGFSADSEWGINKTIISAS